MLAWLASPGSSRESAIATVFFGELSLTCSPEETQNSCGAISSYNSDEPVDLRNWFNIISMRITVRGFIVTDFMAKWGEAATEVQKAIADGRFLTEGTETKVKSKFEDIPKTWTGLFKVSDLSFQPCKHPSNSG